MQLLAENAVKHNVILPRRPLRVEILVEQDGYLTVRNNLQRKRTGVLSNGVELSTITAQYINLRQAVPRDKEEKDLFIIQLPLIALYSEKIGLAEVAPRDASPPPSGPTMF